MSRIEVYGTGEECSWCIRCCELLDRKEQKYVYRNIREDDEAMTQLRSQGFSSVPQIFIEGKHIGGYNELRLMYT